MKFYLKFILVIVIGWFPLQLLHEVGHIISCKLNGGIVHKIGNGLYIGLGWLCDGGDGWELIRYNVNLLWLILFGLPSSLAGMIILMKIKERQEEQPPRA